VAGPRRPPPLRERKLVAGMAEAVLGAGPGLRCAPPDKDLAASWSSGILPPKDEGPRRSRLPVYGLYGGEDALG